MNPPRLQATAHAAIYDFGGEGPELHFAYANGYPPPAYAPLIAALTPHYHVTALRSRPLQPGARPADLHGWQPLADEMLAHLEQAGAGARARLGVGHSLGAVITAAAALRRPEFFSAVVLIEPVFFAPPRMRVYSLLRRLGLTGLVNPLVAAARRRRAHFASADEMLARYRRAPIFSGLDDIALRAYVDALAAPHMDGPGVELAFSPAWEARIYETGPLDLWGQIGRLRPPVLAIRGAQSNTFDPGAMRALQRRLPQAQIREVPNSGHLVPLEQPARVADLILDFARHQRAT